MIRNLLFLLPPEKAHNLALFFIRLLGFLHRIGLWERGPWATHLRLCRETPFGKVSSPLGLAAGMDKNAVALWGWQGLGFGFVEVGTATPIPQEGNAQPRLFRYTRFGAIVNRMGFNNDGAATIADRVRLAKRQGLSIKVGANIGKNKNTPLHLAAQDYARAAREFKNTADFLVVNVSSPNTPALRDLQNAAQLDEIISKVREVDPQIPLFIKVAPDNFQDFVQGITAIARKYSVAGIICGNTLANHASCKGLSDQEIARLPQGGLSGRPLFEINVHLCEAYAVSNPDLFVVGTGGIENLTTAVRYFQAGAKLIEVYSGLVYGGPSFVKNLLSDLIRNSEERQSLQSVNSPSI